MAFFKPIRLLSGQLSSYPKKEGQVLYTTDTASTYIDISNTERIQITDIKLLTEDERIDMLAPIAGFYYTTDTYTMWYSDGLDWYTLSLNIDDINPTYADRTELETLTSGENIAIALAKTKHAVTQLINHLNNTSNPHKATKAQLGLGKVENKSSSDIRDELTSDNVTKALGYTPPTQDTTYGVASSSKLGLIKAGGDIYVGTDGSVTILNANTADKITTPVNIALSGQVLGSVSFDGSQNVTILTSIESLDVSKLVGIISLENLPKAALERLVPVANKDARLALTSDDVQKGDTVKEEDTGMMYYVVDDTKLNSEEGYAEYTAGSASSVPWAGITGKPDSYTPSVHTHTKSEITDFPTSMPASDVYSWAKQAVKPSYTPSEVGVIGTAPTSGQVAVFDGTTGKIKSTGFTIGTSVPANAKFTDTVYNHPSYTEHVSGLYKITVDGTGHVSGVSPVTADDITQLGISVDVATESIPGTIKSGGDVTVASDGTVTVNNAKKLKTSVKIGEANFDGSADVTLQQMGIKNPIELTKAEYESLKAAGKLDMEAYYNIIDDYDAITIIDDTIVAENQVFSSNKTEATYAKKSIVYEAILTSASWSGTSAPYSYTIAVNSATADNIIEIVYDSSATNEQIEAYQGADLRDGGQSAGSITLKAYGDKPSVDIPITITVRNDT